MDVLKDFKQTLGISYLDPQTKRRRSKNYTKKKAPTLSVRDSILKYLDRPQIQSMGGE